jgi:hypothetical protein
MSKIALFVTLLVTTSCRKPAEKTEVVDNPATRYVDGLHQDVNKARDAADIANKKISEYNQTVETTENN